MGSAKLGDNIFRAYDVRGIYPIDLDETTAEAVGRGFGEYIGRGKTILLCRDGR
jgi:phosphomannomutase